MIGGISKIRYVLLEAYLKAYFFSVKPETAGEI